MIEEKDLGKIEEFRGIIEIFETEDGVFATKIELIGNNA